MPAYRQTTSRKIRAACTMGIEERCGFYLLGSREGKPHPTAGQLLRSAVGHSHLCGSRISLLDRAMGCRGREPPREAKDTDSRRTALCRGGRQRHAFVSAICLGSVLPEIQDCTGVMRLPRARHANAEFIGAITTLWTLYREVVSRATTIFRVLRISFQSGGPSSGLRLMPSLAESPPT